MGAIAAEMLIRHVEAHEVVPPQKVVLEATLVVRGSTRPPAGAAPRAVAARLPIATVVSHQAPPPPAGLPPRPLRREAP
jgi:hypothetical protein